MCYSCVEEVVHHITTPPDTLRLPLQAYNYVGISTGMNFVKRLAKCHESAPPYANLDVSPEAPINNTVREL